MPIIKYTQEFYDDDGASEWYESTEINTDNVEPLIFMTDEVNRLREDVVIQNTSKQEALLNAPAKDSDYFRVPKVLDK